LLGISVDPSEDMAVDSSVDPSVDISVDPSTDIDFVDTVVEIDVDVDAIKMTPLHVLCCNPNVNAKMIILLKKRYGRR
jgi:hypothetical protein